jgi:hypothetical protein
MPVVHFGFTPAPVHVRTARLVAASVAQQASLTGEVLSEVRQAAGEACSRAVARHRRYGVRDLVRMKMTIGERFVAEVADFAPVTRSSLRASAPADAGLAVIRQDEDTLTEEVALTLLAGLVTDLQVIQGEGGLGTIVRMAWQI